VQHPLISRCDDWGTRPNPALMRDAKAVQIFDGSNQIQRLIVSKNIILD
jgi:alkylation response protein AidB-like acyl-CoA dehydrogenase